MTQLGAHRFRNATSIVWDLKRALNKLINQFDLINEFDLLSLLPLSQMQFIDRSQTW